MKIKSRIIVTLLLVLTFIITLSFHLNIMGSASSLKESISQIIRTHRIPYCNIALINNGTVEYESLTLNGEELSQKHLFLSGQITEILTGISLNILFSKGILSPDDKITKFYPWLTFTYENAPVEITISQLASHSSGIPLHTQGELYGNDYDGMLRTAMHGVSGSSLNFMPGTAYRNIQTDYAILAFIIEKVTGSTWSEYVTKNVIQPLGLKNTYIGYDNVPKNAKIIGGSRTCALFIIDYDIKLNSANSPSKGMLTCCEDLVRLIRILSGEIDIPQNSEQPEYISQAVEMLMTNNFCAFSPAETGSDAFFGGIFFSKEPGTFYLSGQMENFSTSIRFCTADNQGIDQSIRQNADHAIKQGIIVQCSGMKAPAAKILENCQKQLEEKDDFLLSFISTETLDIINTFLCIIVIYLCVLNIISIKTPRKKGYSKIRVVAGITFTLLYMACTALFPFYLDCTYSMIFWESVLMITVFIGLSQILGIISLCRIIKKRKGARKKAGYNTVSGSYYS